MLQRSLRGGVAGALATVVMTLEQPLDKRHFDSRYDVEILGKLGAYTRLKPGLHGPPVLRGLLVGLIEHVAAWPLTVVFDRYHPARKELPKLATNPRAFGQATIRHAVFGIVLGLLEETLNRRT
jgi:hypothetical protein